jgi:two-component system nitrogen regulation response regulator NtrX
MAGERILIVDDERGIRATLSGILGDEGYRAHAAATGQEAFARIGEEVPDLVVLDIWLPEMDGIDVLAELKRQWPELPVVMMSGHGTIETAVKATKLGAYDFVEKPLSLEKTLLVVERALEHARLERENRQLRERIERAHEIIGTSPAIMELRRQIGTAAPTNGRVLIFGENGAGKELVARAIHALSVRRDRPFVEVNCAAIPDELIESELFGHEKGAFTGAMARRRGKFELATGGTLFLDEIGDMSLKTQAKVLRALEEQTVERIGGHEPIRVDVRVIAASNQALPDLIAQGRFREDLFYRLNVVSIYLPPLRNRREDIPELLQHYLDVAAIELGVAPKVLTEEAARALTAFDWPGNVRQLVNACRRLTVLAAGREVRRGDIPGDLGGGVGLAMVTNGSPDWSHALASWAQAKLLSGGTPLLEEAMPEFERTLLREALKVTRGGRQDAAKLLGWGRNTLTRKLKELGMDDL